MLDLYLLLLFIIIIFLRHSNTDCNNNNNFFSFLFLNGANHNLFIEKEKPLVSLFWGSGEALVGVQGIKNFAFWMQVSAKPHSLSK